MLEINGKWFYKSPKAKTVDLMSAFFEKPLNDKCDLTLKIFAPPANGLNDLSEEDGLFNSYTTLEKAARYQSKIRACGNLTIKRAFHNEMLFSDIYYKYLVRTFAEILILDKFSYIFFVNPKDKCKLMMHQSLCLAHCLFVSGQQLLSL